MIKMFYLIVLLVYLSLITYLPQVKQIFMGDPLGVTTTEAGWGLRLLREGSVFVISVIMFFYFLFGKLQFRAYSTLIISLFLLTYLILQFQLSIHNGYPLIVPLAGARIFQYLPIFILGYYFSKEYPELLDKFSKYLILFVILQSLIGVFQVYYFPPLQGSTIFGSRASGTFGSANQYGILMSTCCLLFFLSSKYKIPKYLCLFMAILSGSRAAIVSISLVFLFPLFLIKDYFLKLLAMMLVPLIFLMIFYSSSLEIISGRVGTTISATQGYIKFFSGSRVNHWSSVLSDNVNSVSDLVLGWGLGLGSNGLAAAFGINAFQGQFISDNQYLSILSGFGLIGLLIYICMLSYTLFFDCSRRKTLFILFVGFLGLPLNILENFPNNLILLFIWGWLLGERSVKPNFRNHQLKTVE